MCIPCVVAVGRLYGHPSHSDIEFLIVIAWVIKANRSLWPWLRCFREGYEERREALS